MRGWHEWVAALGDLVPGGVPVIGLALVFLTTIGSLLWYFWPDWLPGRRARSGGGRRRSGRRRPGLRWPGFRALRLALRRPWLWLRWRFRLRWRWRRRHRGGPEAPLELPPDQLPELPAATLVISADELAAQGRYKEAVRERLRAIVRELVEHGVLTYRPGWTVTELAAIAGGARPDTAASLAAASEIFSSIWYGQRPAQPADDAAMRHHAGQVRAALAPQEVSA